MATRCGALHSGRCLNGEAIRPYLELCLKHGSLIESICCICPWDRLIVIDFWCVLVALRNLACVYMQLNFWVWPSPTYISICV